jgi:hypothetical protein
MNPLHKILEHKFFVILSVIGGLVFTLWEPLTAIFYTGFFHTNIILDVSTESFPLDNSKQLLVIHITPSNKGNVPLIIKEKNAFTLEVKKIKDMEVNKWTDYARQNLVSKVDVLRNMVMEKGDSYTLEPGGVYEEVESIPLENGIYYINANLNFNGEYVNQTAVIKLPTKNK